MFLAQNDDEDWREKSWEKSPAMVPNSGGFLRSLDGSMWGELWIILSYLCGSLWTMGVLKSGNVEQGTFR